MRLFICILFFSLSNALISQVPPRFHPEMSSEKISSPISIDGALSDPAWLVATPVELLYEMKPGDNLPARQRTVVRSVYDDSHIYFSFLCYDTDPTKIRANLTDRDQIFDDDNVFVLLDLYHDTQKAIELGVNPFGVQGDLMATAESEDASFDMIWYSGAQRHDSGWSAEIKIPFTSLHYPDREEQVWGIHLVRNFPRESKIAFSWAAINKHVSSLLPQTGTITGISISGQGGLIELLPYALFQKSIVLQDYSDPDAGKAYPAPESRFGFGLKYMPAPDFTLNAVLNPDFSQIESDADQISVNAPFALNFPEKRPFFLNGAELFYSDIYYSRSINDPLGAATVNGRSGGMSYYFLSAYDRKTIITVPNEYRSHTAATNLHSLANITRVRYDFGNETFVGGHLYSRNLDGGANYLAGIDFNYKMSVNWSLRGELYATLTEELNLPNELKTNAKIGTTDHTVAFDGEHYTGIGGKTQLRYGSKHYNGTFSVTSIMPTFQSYNGLVTMVNFYEAFTNHSFTAYPEDSFLDKLSFSCGTGFKWAFNGVHKEQFLYPQVSFLFKGQTELGIAYMPLNDEVFFGKWYRGMTRLSVEISSRPIKELTFEANGSIGKYIYRTSTPELGEGHNASISVTFKPSSQFSLEASYSRARLESIDRGNLLYDGNLYRVTGIYQFSQELFVRVITQVNTFDSYFSVYPLISYKLNAFTTFFLGANSEYIDYDQPYGVRNAGQHYFLKVQYLLGFNV